MNSRMAAAEEGVFRILFSLKGLFLGPKSAF